MKLRSQFRPKLGQLFAEIFQDVFLRPDNLAAKSCPILGRNLDPSFQKNYPAVKLRVDFFERETAKINSSSGHLSSSTQSVSHEIDIDKLEAFCRHPKWNGKFLSPTTRSVERGQKGSFPIWAPTMSSIADDGECFSVRQCSVLPVGHGGRNCCSGRPWIWST